MSIRRKLGRLKRRIKFDLVHIRKKDFKNIFQLKTGFFDESVKIMGINRNNYKNFVNDRMYWFGHPWNGTLTYIIDNKLFLPYLLCNYKNYLPETYLYKDDFGFLPIFDGLNYQPFQNKIRLQASEILDFIKLKKEIVLKPTSSSKGDGFNLIEFRDGKWYRNLNEIDVETLTKFLDSLHRYIAQEKIQQSKWSATINASSVNSIRLQCGWNTNKKSFEIVRITSKYGIKGQLVDNLGQGNGILAYADPLTGELKKEGVINENGVTRHISGEIIHPDSGVKISGNIIPNYLEIKDKIIEISNSISFLRWIGWDIALTDTAFKIIETNSLSSLASMQQSKGLLEEEGIKHIFHK